MNKIAKLALPVALLATLASNALAADLTLPQLIEKNNQARGGKAAWDAAKSLRVTGTFELAPEMVAPFTLVLVKPDLFRMDFEFQGMQASQVFDGQVGWHRMPFMGSPDPQKSAPDQVRQAQRMTDLAGPLIDSEKKGYQIELLGKEDVAGKPAYKLKVTKGEEVTTLYLDAEKFLDLKEVRTATTDQGMELVIEIQSTDWKPVGGLLFAHTVQSTVQGMPQGQKVNIAKVEVNPADIPADFFKMPPPAPKPPAAPAPPADPKPPGGQN
jgi:outer membrane lipoprotein-sorting protein